MYTEYQGRTWSTEMYKIVCGVQPYDDMQDTKAAFTLGHFKKNVSELRTYRLSVKKLPFRLFVYINPTKMHDENDNF